MERIQAPFTDEQVENLNSFQENQMTHPFTCAGEEGNFDCERISQTGEGVLKATTDGWVCPCGKYTQNWAHRFMSEKMEIKDPFDEPGK